MLDWAQLEERASMYSNLWCEITQRAGLQQGPKEAHLSTEWSLISSAEKMYRVVGLVSNIRMNLQLQALSKVVAQSQRLQRRRSWIGRLAHNEECSSVTLETRRAHGRYLVPRHHQDRLHS